MSRIPCIPSNFREAATLIILSPQKFFSPTPKSQDFPFRVLLLQRNNTTRFMKNAFVFPGGVLDQRNDANASFWKDSAQGNALPADWKYRVCAMREAFEECGLCLTEPKLPHEWRKEVHSDATAFHTAVKKHNSRLQFERLRPFERWITPQQEFRRYDTRFYVTRIETEQEMQEINHDGVEMVNLAWMTPPEALQKAKELALPPPTWKILRDLTQIGQSVEDFSHNQWFESSFQEQFDRPFQPTLEMSDSQLKQVVLDGNRGRIIRTDTDEFYRFEEDSTVGDAAVKRSRL